MSKIMSQRDKQDFKIFIQQFESGYNINKTDLSLNF